jgi:hypothetical protein
VGLLRQEAMVRPWSDDEKRIFLDKYLIHTKVGSPTFSPSRVWKSLQRLICHGRNFRETAVRRRRARLLWTSVTHTPSWVIPCHILLKPGKWNYWYEIERWGRVEWGGVGWDGRGVGVVWCGVVWCGVVWCGVYQTKGDISVASLPMASFCNLAIAICGNHIGAKPCFPL